MRILIIHNQYQHIGGEDFVIRQEMDILLKSHQVELYSVKNQKGLSGYKQYLSYPLNIGQARKIQEKIDLFKPDLIHIHNIHYGIGPFFIRKIKKRNIPIVMTLHNFRLLCPTATLFYNGNIYLESLKANFPWDAVKKKALENSYLKTFWTAFTYWTHKTLGTFSKIDRFIILSDFAKNIFLERSLKVSKDKFIVKPNFVPDLSPDRIIDDNSFLYIGRLSEEKGIIPLLHAWRATNFPLKIFGAGPLQAEVEQICGHSENIKYFGFQSQETIREHLSGATALIVPSVCYESMPLSILEAFALGIPVIASNIGILTEMIVPLYTGLLFDPHHHADIVKSLTEWMNISPEKKKEIKENCRAEYLAKYERSLVMNQLQEIYHQVIKINEGK